MSCSLFQINQCPVRTVAPQAQSWSPKDPKAPPPNLQAEGGAHKAELFKGILIQATEENRKECSTFYLFLRNYSTFTNYEIKNTLELLNSRDFNPVFFSNR